MRTAATIATVLAVAMTSSTALADDAIDPVADKLFNDGRQLARAGNYAAACDKFTKAFALDHGYGIETNLADCHEHLGHAALAWHMFVEVAEASERNGNASRAKLVRSRLAALARRVGTLAIRIAEPTLAGLTLTLDGRPLIPTQVIREVIDPSDVKVVATAPGRKLFAKTSHVGPGETVIVDVMLEPDARADADAPGPSSPVVTAPPVSAPTRAAVGPTDASEPTDASSGRRRRSWLYASIGTGVVATASAITGVVLAVSAKRDYDRVTNDTAHCTPGDPPQCDSIGQTGIDHSQHTASLATGFAVGAAVLGAAAVVVFVIAPRDTAVSVSPTGVALAGHF